MYQEMTRHNSPSNNFDFPSLSLPHLRINTHIGAAAIYLMVILVILQVLNMLTPTLVAQITFGQLSWISGALVVAILVFISLDPQGAKGAVKF